MDIRQRVEDFAMEWSEEATLASEVVGDHFREGLESLLKDLDQALAEAYRRGAGRMRELCAESGNMGPKFIRNLEIPPDDIGGVSG